jgi:DNA repair exonuclease SbcCD ATPase subunit
MTYDSSEEMKQKYDIFHRIPFYHPVKGGCLLSTVFYEPTCKESLYKSYEFFTKLFEETGLLPLTKEQLVQYVPLEEYYPFKEVKSERARSIGGTEYPFVETPESDIEIENKKLKDLVESLNNQNQQLIDEIEQYKNRIKDLQIKIQTTKEPYASPEFIKQYEDLKKQLEIKENYYAYLLQKFRELESGFEQTRNFCEQQNEDITTLQNTIDKLTSRNSILERDKSSLQKEKENLEKYNEMLTEETITLKSKNNTYKKENERLKGRITELENQIKGINTNYEIQQNTLTDTRRRLDNKKEQYNKLMSNYEILETQLKELYKYLQNANEVFEQLRKENSDLKEENEHLQNLLSQFSESDLAEVVQKLKEKVGGE